MAQDIRENTDYQRGVRNTDLYGDEDLGLDFLGFDDEPVAKDPLKKKKVEQQEKEDLGYTPMPKEPSYEDIREGTDNLITRAKLNNAGIQPFTYSPIQKSLTTGIGDYGKYRRERNVTPNVFDSYENLENRRAELQPAINQWVDGITKGIITAGVTFLNGTAGMGWGLLSMAPAADKNAIADVDDANFFKKRTKDEYGLDVYDKDGNFIPKEEREKFAQQNGLKKKSAATRIYERIWNNELSSAFKEIQDMSEKWLPNYYTDKELTSRHWYDNVFTANFWADKFVKNLGFTVGAFYSGKTYSSLLKGLGEAGKLGRFSMQAVGSLGSAMAEGMFEAETNAKEWRELEFAKAKDEYLAKVNEIQQRYGIAGSLSEAFGEAGKDPNMQRELQALRDDYKKRIAKINVDAARVGNSILAMNIPILSFSNLIRFGRMYSGNYNPYRSWFKGHVSGKPGEYEYASNLFGIKIPKATTTAAGDFAKYASKNFIAEGGEEFLQRWASNTATMPRSADVLDFMKNGSDYQDKSSWELFYKNAIDSFVYTAKETGAGGAWEEFFIGGITGLFGVPGFRSIRNAQGKLQFPVKWEGSALSTLKDIRERRADVKAAIDRMNKFVADSKDKKSAAEYILNIMTGKGDYIEGLKRHLLYDEKKAEAAKEGDEFEYQQSNLRQLISDIIMFYNTGKIDDFKTILQSMIEKEELSDEDYEAIKNATKEEYIDPETKQTKLRGPFMKSDTEFMSKKDMLDDIKRNANQINDTIDAVIKTADTINNQTFGNVTKDKFNNLVYLAMMRDQNVELASQNMPDFVDYIKEFRNNMQSQKNQISSELSKEEAAKQEKQNEEIDKFTKILDGLIELGEKAIADPENTAAKSGFITMFAVRPSREGMKNGPSLSSYMLSYDMEHIDKEGGDINAVAKLIERAEKVKTAKKALEYSMAFAEKFNLYMSDDSAYRKDIDSVNEELKNKKQKEDTNEAIAKLKEKLVPDAEGKTAKLGLSDIEELVKDDTDLAGLKQTLLDDDTLKDYAKYIDDIAFKKDFLDYLDNAKPEDFELLKKAIGDIKDIGGSKSLQSFIENSLLKEKDLKKLGLLTGLSGADLANAAKNFRKALIAFKKNKEEAAKAAEAAKKPGKKPEKAPEPPAPAFSGNKAQRSQISKTVEEALSKGEVDFMEILKNYTVSDLEGYRKLLKKEEKGTLSDAEIENAALIIEQIDDTLKLLAEAEQNGIRVIGENPDEEFEQAFEKAEKAVREALDRDESELTEADVRSAEGILRNFVISEYDFKEGKEHRKVQTSSNPFAEVLRAFNVQEFIDSGKFVELLKRLEETYGEGVGNKVTVLRYLKPGEKKAAFHLAFKIEDDSILRKLYKLRSSESLENLAGVPIIRDEDNNQTYVLVGRLGHHGDNNSQFEAVTDAVKRLKNQTKFTYKKGEDSYTFNDTGVELWIEKVYSGRFGLNTDSDGNEVMQPVTNLEGYEIGHVVIDRQTGKTRVIGVDTMPLNSHVSSALRRGMVVLAVKGADGIKYPTVAKVNRFTPEEVSEDSAAYKEVARLVENFVKQALSGTTLAASRAKRELASGKNGKGLLYFGNNSLLFKKNEKNGKVLFSFKNSDGTTSMIINTNKIDDATDAIVTYLYNKDRNIPFNVSTNASRAVSLGMVETPLASTRNFNGSFDLYSYGTQGSSNTGHTGSKVTQEKEQKIMINGTLLDKEDISQMNQLVPDTGTITYAELLDRIATIVSENFSAKDGIEEMTIDGTTYWFIKTDGSLMQEPELIAVSKGKTEFAWTLHTGDGVKELYAKAKKGRKRNAATKPGKQVKVEKKPEDEGPDLFNGIEEDIEDSEEKSGDDIINEALATYNSKPMQTALTALAKDKDNATARSMFEKQLNNMLGVMAKALGISNTAVAIQQIKDVYLEMAELNPECLMQQENIKDGLTYIADKVTFEGMAYEQSYIDALRDKLLCF